MTRLSGQSRKGFRDREKDRLRDLKPQLLSEHARSDGMYGGSRRSFCIHEDHSEENLWEGIREEALAYFRARGIPWHDGLPDKAANPAGKPSNHLCCSQSSCVNALFAFREEPEALAMALRSLGMPIAEVLPFDADSAPVSPAGTIAFEWIGLKNYLRETRFGRVVSDAGRSRGKGFTSADFAIRYRDFDGVTCLLLGEWKYTENYRPVSLRYSDKKTDRLEIYRAALDAPWTQVRLPEGITRSDLCFDPFLQLMRLQLLSGEIEHAARVGSPEMRAMFASVVHIAPACNGELMSRETSPGLARLGSSLHQIWNQVAVAERFRGIDLLDLLGALLANAPDRSWADYISARYLGMQ